jgi:hypothetical protein
MKYVFLIILSFFIQISNAQTTETFESESSGSIIFSDNGQTFNITSQNGTFDIQTGYPGTGWSGFVADNRYIDNDTFLGTGGTQFTISSTYTFAVTNFWIYLANSSANVNVTGSLTIVGKLSGSTVFTSSATSPFNNTNVGVNNGFTFIDFSSFGGQNNANTFIDELVITTTSNFVYVAMDAFTWRLGSLSASSFAGYNSIKIYPNPTSDYITLLVEDNVLFSTIHIIDITGKIVKKEDFNSSEVILDVKDLPKGIYFITEKSTNLNIKFVKN